MLCKITTFKNVCDLSYYTDSKVRQRKRAPLQMLLYILCVKNLKVYSFAGHLKTIQKTIFQVDFCKKSNPYLFSLSKTSKAKMQRKHRPCALCTAQTQNEQIILFAKSYFERKNFFRQKKYFDRRLTVWFTAVVIVNRYIKIIIYTYCTYYYDIFVQINIDKKQLDMIYFKSGFCPHAFDSRFC